MASHHGAAASGVIAITNPCFSLSTPGVPEMRNAGSRQKPDQPPTLYKSSKTQCAADSELLKKSEAKLISSILDERGQSAESGPEQPVADVEGWPQSAAFEHGNRLAEGQDFRGGIGSCLEGSAECNEKEREHEFTVLT